MSKYIEEFKKTGDCIINVELVCKNWNDRFSISTWISGDKEEYTFIVNGKRKNTLLCKVQISKEQCIDLVKKLNLIHVKSPLFKSGGSYHSESFVKSEIERISMIKQEKERELAFISSLLDEHQSCF